MTLLKIVFKEKCQFWDLRVSVFRFFGDDIQDLGAISANGPTLQEGGSHNEVPIFDDYINRLIADANTGDFTVIWDCGNGASGPATIAATQKITGDHKVLFGDIDGTFPNHHPNPVDPELKQLDY